MYSNEEFRQDMPYGLDNDIDINITNQNTNTNVNEDFVGGMNYMQSTMTSPIVEPGREKCVYRNIYHEVPQV